MNLNLGTIFTVMRLQDEMSGPYTALARTVQTRSGELTTDIEAVTVRLGAVNQRVKEFSGIPAMRSAEEMAAAVTKLGGASKLTADEQARVNSVVTAALDKYRALGQEAPKHLQELANATQKQSTLMGGLNGVLGQFGLSLGTLTAGGALAAAAGGVVKFGSDALRAAGQLTDLSARTGLTVQELQRLEIAGVQVGVSLDQSARAINMLQKNLGGDDEGAVAAVHKLGLNVQQLLRSSPGQMFETIAQAVAQIPDPTERTRVAIEVLGKSGAETLPLLLADIDKLTEGVRRMKDTTVQDLDELGDEWDKMLLDLRNGAGETYAFLKRLTAAKREFNESLDRELPIMEEIRKHGAAAYEQQLQAAALAETQIPTREKMLRDLGLIPGRLTSAAEATIQFEKANGSAYKKLLQDLSEAERKTIQWNGATHELALGLARLEDLSKNPQVFWNETGNEMAEVMDRSHEKVMRAIDDMVYLQSTTVKWGTSGLESAADMEAGLKRVEGAVEDLNGQIDAAANAWAVSFELALTRIERRFFDWGGNVFGVVKGLFSGLGDTVSTLVGGFAGHFMSGLSSIITGGITSLINMGIGLVMKGLSRLWNWVTGLFKGEGAKTNDIRDEWMSSMGGLAAVQGLIASFGNDWRLLQAFEKAYVASSRAEFLHWIAIFESRLAELRGGAPIETTPPSGGGSGGGGGGGGGGGPIGDGDPGAGFVAGFFDRMGRRAPGLGLAGAGGLTVSIAPGALVFPNAVLRDEGDVRGLAELVGRHLTEEIMRVVRLK